MSTMIGLSPRQILERRILYKHGRTPSCVFSGSLPRPKTSSTVYKDYSQYKNDGTITGATWVKSNGGIWGLSYDGNDYVNCGNRSSLNLTGNRTIIAWVNVSATANNSVISRAAFGVESYVFQLLGDSFALGMCDAGGAWRGWNQSAAYTFTVGTWYQVAVSFDLANIVYYANGVAPFAPIAWAFGATLSSNLNTYIGCQYQAATNLFNGTIDFLRVFNRAMPAEEISGIFRTERHLFGV